jgi:ribosome biogenesis GTPase A
VVDAQDIAWFAIHFLVDRYPERVTAHYDLPTLPKGEEAILEAIGRRRGYLRKGGVVDLERAANAVLRDLAGGDLGPISLETPADCGVAPR